MKNRNDQLNDEAGLSDADLLERSRKRSPSYEDTEHPSVVAERNRKPEPEGKYNDEVAKRELAKVRGMLGLRNDTN